MFLPNQQRWQMVFHSTKSCHMSKAVSPHLCIRSSSQYSLVNLSIWTRYIYLAIWTKLTTKLNYQKSLPVTRQRIENMRTSKIWRKPNKTTKQFPYWFCMTLSDTSLLWLSFSCYLWQHTFYLYVRVVPLSEVRSTAVLLFPGNKKGLQQPQSLCAHSQYWPLKNWHIALHGEGKTTGYGSDSWTIAWVGFTGLKEDALA